jgi:lysophospholipase L1-like esterase
LLSSLLLAGALGSAFAVPASAAVDRTRTVNLKKVHRIVTLGDSITQGGARPGGYVWQINEYLQVLYPRRKIEVVNAGISGHKSNDMLGRFQRDVLDKKPDLVTISVGINDVWHGFTPEHPAGYGPRRVPLDQYRKNVEAMLQAAAKAGAQVVMFTTTIFEDQPNSIRNLKVAGYNDTLRDLAREYGATLADQNAAFMDAWKQNGSSGAKLTSDQVHMAPAGDTLMALTALRAFGVSERELERARPEVEKKMPRR